MVKNNISKHREEIIDLIEKLKNFRFNEFTKAKEFINHDNRYFKDICLPTEFIDFSVPEYTAENIVKIIEESIDFPIVKANEK